MFTLYFTLALFGLMAGITTLLFGFGGGFIIVPLLYRTLLTLYGADSAIGQAAMHIAVATSTCVMIVSSAMATRRHWRKGNLILGQAWPLAGYIALGAVAGSLLANATSGGAIRWLFVAYLAVTIADGLLRKGFISQRTTPALYQQTAGKTALSGLVIGTIATFLGVGGSVMTVPMMRRRGLSMNIATAMANPLSMPVAIVGTLTYMVASPGAASLPGHGYWGYVDMLAFLVLLAGSWLGMQAATPWVGRIPDKLHAKIYLALLTLVLLTMAL
jgi:uncharacterized membrane protein YfcA